MHALPQRRTTRLAMLAGAAAMGAALIGGPAEAAEAATPVPAATATNVCVPKTRTAAQVKRDRVIALAKKYSGRAQGKKGKKVSRKNARRGDLVIFRDSSGRAYHAAIYAGGNKMYDAPTYGKTTGRHRIWSNHVEFRRVL